jgi:hypothetical protein
MKRIMMRSPIRLLASAGRVAIMLAGFALPGAPAMAGDQLLPAGKCPFTLGVPASMRMQPDPFGTLDNVGMSYRGTDDKGAVLVTYTQRRADTSITYAIRCSTADPAKWLTRFGGEQEAVCKEVNKFPDAERKANAYCALTTKDDARLLTTGTWSKDPKNAAIIRSQARFTAARPGVGMISARVSVVSPDSGKAKALADELVATLRVAGPAK